MFAWECCYNFIRENKMACKYSDSLGVPGQGFHKHYAGVAIMDLFGTLMICAIIWYYTDIDFLLVVFVVMLLTIFLHRIFCVNTTLNKFLFGPV